MKSPSRIAYGTAAARSRAATSHRLPRRRLVADGGEVGGDGVAVAGQEPDAFGDAVVLLLQRGDHLRRRVIRAVDGLRLAEAGQELLDDAGRYAAVEQAPDLHDPVHE